MNREQSSRLPIRHIGYLSLCRAEYRADNIARVDLGAERYRILGVRERLKDQAPYRICKRCIARLP